MPFLNNPVRQLEPHNLKPTINCFVKTTPSFLCSSFKEINVNPVGNEFLKGFDFVCINQNLYPSLTTSRWISFPQVPIRHHLKFIKWKTDSFTANIFFIYILN